MGTGVYLDWIEGMGVSVGVLVTTITGVLLVSIVGDADVGVFIRSAL